MPGFSDNYWVLLNIVAWLVWGNHSTCHVGFLAFGLRFEPYAYRALRHGWHQVLRLSLHETAAAFTCQLSGVSVCMCGLCVMCCVCVFLRYPELQQSLYIYLIVSDFIIIICVTISNPVTAVQYILSLCLQDFSHIPGNCVSFYDQRNVGIWGNTQVSVFI
jgi:hypothetical protein